MPKFFITGLPRSRSTASCGLGGGGTVAVTPQKGSLVHSRLCVKVTPY